MVPFRKGADGVVARESCFVMRFETFACARPPRLRRLRWLRSFLLKPQPPLSRGGECAQPNSLLIHSHVLTQGRGLRSRSAMRTHGPHREQSNLVWARALAQPPKHKSDHENR